MTVDVIFLPSLLQHDLSNKTVVVFDVLRATTTITAALAAGVESVQAFADLPSAASAASAATPRPILCGEVNCLPPAGFDLGNSPAQFTAAHAGRQIFLSTTNGTKALVAARSAAAIFAGALVNATAVARQVASARRDVILLCSGTNADIAMEDILGAGAVLSAMMKPGSVTIATDTALIALRLFESARSDLRNTLRASQGGRNIIRAGLDPDIDFAARLDVFDVVGEAEPTTLVLRAARR